MIKYIKKKIREYCKTVVQQETNEMKKIIESDLEKSNLKKEDYDIMYEFFLNRKPEDNLVINEEMKWKELFNEIINSEEYRDIQKARSEEELELRKSVLELENMQKADKDDYLAFYRLLLQRNPEEEAIQVGEVLRKDLFNSIALSEEHSNLSLFGSKIDESQIPTYSQAGEDSILAYVFGTLKLDMRKVTYLDLGANRVKNLSNTYFFYEKGAKGVLVDANPQLTRLLEEERGRDVTLNKCISNHSGDIVDFYILNNDGLSSPIKECVDEVLRENSALYIKDIVKIETISVEDILNQYFPIEAPTILNIDIEGNEMEILSNIDFDKYRPMIIICEMIPYSKNLVINDKNKSIEEYMNQQGYVEYAFTGINSIFIDTRAKVLNYEEKNSIS